MSQREGHQSDFEKNAAMNGRKGRFKKTLFAALLLGAGLLMGTVFSSFANSGLITSNQPGSIDDPLVTKSYVDQVLANLGLGEDRTEDGKILTVVELGEGHSLIAFEGTEFIVRTGRTVAFSRTTDGIPDLTAGENLDAGTVLPHNHLLLFPRNDGRGIRHDGKGIAYIMVRGPYQHLDEEGQVIAERR